MEKNKLFLLFNCTQDQIEIPLVEADQSGVCTVRVALEGCDGSLFSDAGGWRELSARQAGLQYDDIRY